jgi:hypothetical protein
VAHCHNLDLVSVVLDFQRPRRFHDGRLEAELDWAGDRIRDAVVRMLGRVRGRLGCLQVRLDDLLKRSTRALRICRSTQIAPSGAVMASADRQFCAADCDEAEHGIVAQSVLLLIGVFVAKSGRLERRTGVLRIASLLLIAVMSLSNAASAGRLIIDVVRGEGIRDPSQLLLTGAAVWFTNVIVFGLWYREFDRGGPIERAIGSQPFPDFLFPQMTSPELAPADWEPGFVDYLYVSFTNATAFSPTDVMPMTRWAKLTMLAQSAISVITVALVIARAVNILK